MKLIAIPLLLLSALPSLYSAPQRPNQQNLQPPARANQQARPAVRRALVQDAIFTFYYRQFQRDGEFTPEILPKILPFLDQFLQDRFEISERRTRALDQLRQALANNGSEEDLKRLGREIDAADAEFLANHQKFLNNVDPLLTARQQAKVRILQNMADNQIRQMLNAVQNPNAQQRRALAPASPQ
jgi:hypothetical protein